MSQEKVDKYKHQKAHRREIMRKERMKSLVRRSILAVLAIALVAWLGFSAHDSWVRNQPRHVAEVNFDSITEFMNSQAEAGNEVAE